MKNIVFKCGFCGKEYKRISDQHQHEKWCKKNPNHLIKKSSSSSEKWLEAMHQRKGHGTNQFTKAKKLGLPPPVSPNKGKQVWFGKKHSEESKKKISESMRKLIREGNREYSFLHRKSYEFEGERLDSSYELKVAQELKEHKIKFETHPNGLSYRGNDGTIRTYFPDFYLEDFDVYLDPKNDFLLSENYKYQGLTTKEKIKRVEEYNAVKIIILNKDNLSFNKILENINAVKSDTEQLNIAKNIETIL